MDYLRQAGRLHGPGRVEALSGGVSNIVLRVVTDDGAYVLKQSCPQLRTRDAWFSDLDRVYREQEVMEALFPVLPPLTVPQILFVDRPNYIFAMSHAPEEARVWKQELLAGHVDVALGAHVGRVLGTMHEASAVNRARFEPFRDSTVFVQLRIEPFYRRIQERRPEVAQPVGVLVEEMLSRREALCHGDYTPKNMLLHSRGFMLVDYETAYLGDPAMDLGLCLAHLVLKAHRRPDQAGAYRELLRGFWHAYRAAAPAAQHPERETRAMAHLGACLLARIDGTSPVDYLPEEAKRGAVRDLGRRLLLDKIASWTGVEQLISS